MTEKLDEDFALMMSEVTGALSKFNKHLHIRVEQWMQKLQQTVTNTVWKKHRNEYALVLVDMVRSNALKEPFVKVPPEGPLPKLSKIDFPVLSTSRRSKSPLGDTQLPKTRTVAFSPPPGKQPRSPSFGREENQVLAKGKEIMSKHFIHPLTSSKKRSASFLPTVDSMSILTQQLEESRKREEALQETIASQAQTIREQQQMIAALQAKLSEERDKASHAEAPVDDTADFVKYIDKFQDETVKHT